MKCYFTICLVIAKKNDYLLYCDLNIELPNYVPFPYYNYQTFNFKVEIVYVSTFELKYRLKKTYERVSKNHYYTRDESKKQTTF